jgi:hypothetical protein
VLCTPTTASTAVVALPADHLMEIIAADPRAEHCAGTNDPAVIGCRAYQWFVIGGSAPPSGTAQIR